MKELKYIVEDSILAELLGVQNFSNKESAILELVKNAFDANALNVKIKITKDSIKIIDNGCGMNQEDLIKNWMHIGKSNKGYEIDDENGKTRVQAGSKGVGRFALARLGEEVIVKSHKSGDDTIEWWTDWNSSSLQNCEDMESYGTYMEIRKLRDKWTEKATNLLGDYLSRTYCDNVMSIELYYNETPINVSRVFANPQKGVNYSTKLSFYFDASERKLFCKFDSDEFLKEAQSYCKNNIFTYTSEINLEEEYRNQIFEEELINVNELMTELGDFSAELYFGIDRVLIGDDEKFLYSRKVLEKNIMQVLFYIGIHLVYLLTKEKKTGLV